MEEQQQKINEALDKLDAKNFGIYFFTLDTQGNPSAAIATIYEHVKVLTNLGYKAYILHAKNNYRIRANEHGAGVVDWLGEEYGDLPHISIESQKLNVGPQDFIVIPEVFANVMEQCAKFPCKRIALCQSYDYILELLNLGHNWSSFGINDVITTSQKQADYIKSLFPLINTYVVPVSIPEYFKTTTGLKKPIISLYTREQKDAIKIVKSFYLQYPMYKWLTFRELRGLPRKTFAEYVGESCLCVWVDDISGFGTFPIESIECNTPIIGKIPNLIPEWMEEVNADGKSIQLKNNGIWTNNQLDIPELIAKYMKHWLEDSIPSELLIFMEESKGKYTEERQAKSIESVYGNFVTNRKSEISALAPKTTPVA